VTHQPEHASNHIRAYFADLVRTRSEALQHLSNQFPVMPLLVFNRLDPNSFVGIADGVPVAAIGVPGRKLAGDDVPFVDIVKPVVAMVAGYAIGGGHVLHLCCDLTIAADNARFGQSGPRVGSFDGGYGINLLARQIGEKRAKEVWFLCRQYDAPTALAWGLVNTVVPLERLEPETVSWCREMLRMSPLSLRLLKAGSNAGMDGLAGVQQLAGEPVLPPPPATYPNTTGGKVAKALDEAAALEALVGRGRDARGQ